jgi:hypothetical protein
MISHESVSVSRRSTIIEQCSSHAMERSQDNVFFLKKLCQQANDSCYNLHAYNRSILFDFSFITSLKLPFFSIKII